MGIVDELYQRMLNEALSSGSLLVLLQEMKKSGRLSAVIQGCIHALSRSPGDIRLRQLLAESCLEAGWLSRAEAEVEEVTRQIDELVSAFKLKAEIYNKMRRNEEARKALELYLAHWPGDEEALALLESVAIPDKTLPSPRPALGETGVAATDDFQAETPEGTDLSSLPEIATPTLAEVYFSQGQIQEAIDTYVKVLAQNPQAEESRRRLEELKALAATPPRRAAKETEERLRKKKERMISVLDSWRASLSSASK